MSDTEAADLRLARVRTALVGMVGTDDVDELVEIAQDIRNAHDNGTIDDADRDTILHAVQVLIDIREDDPAKRLSSQ